MPRPRPAAASSAMIGTHSRARPAEHLRATRPTDKRLTSCSCSGWRMLQCSSAGSSAQKIAISTRETHRAKRARRPRARLPHLAVSTTRATGRWTRQIHAESTVYTSSACSTAPSILMICLMSRLSPAARRVPSRAATNRCPPAIRGVDGATKPLRRSPAVRSQPLYAFLAACATGRALPCEGVL